MPTSSFNREPLALPATTPVIIVKELDALSQRAAATAQNIVAANSPHYRPLEVNFATATDTAGRYSALLEMLSREMSIAREVVRGGQ
jgi:flagellar basal body rod protein FlgB